MHRRLTYSIVLAGVLVVSVLHGNMRGAVGSTIQGTVKVIGLASNADAVVYIQQASGPFTAPAEPADMSQKGMQFVPHVLPVIVGTTVRFLNSDTIQHNVLSPDGEKYNLGTWKQGQAKEHTFAKCDKPPCAYTQLCFMHPDMEGYVVVLQNPLFATTGTDGEYKIENVPPGAYSVAVWHADGKAPTRPVTVSGTTTQPTVVDFVVGHSS
jgi:plastocyanin